MFTDDMAEISAKIRIEINTTMRQTGTKQASAFSPANVLGYAISPALKLAVAQSFSRAEAAMVTTNTGMLPLDHSKPELIRKTRKAAATEKGFRIRVGYVSANIKSRTTTFMAQNVLLAHDKSRFEVHVYATTPADSDDLLYNRMRGVDWRKKIQDNVEHFHETYMLGTREVNAFIIYHLYIYFNIFNLPVFMF
jgi:predicted O-linked N-acetylglucosamine transferase (SPINDLY family)